MPLVADAFERAMTGFFRPAHSFVLSGTRLYWVYLLVTGLLAGGVWVYSRRTQKQGFLRFLFPRAVWLHPSAIVDYKFLVVNWALYGAFAAPWVVSLLAVAGATLGALNEVLGARLPVGPVDAWVTIAYGVCLFVAAEVRRYANHWLYHRIPALWEFHKVHHSAQVLTPITFYRVHPVERFLSATVDGLAMGSVTGVFVYFYGRGLTAETVVALNASRWFFVWIGANLRHSHVWWSFGPRIEHVLMSPAQHQIHHSADPRHYDKNFGGALAIWDWMLGTLYVPKGREELVLGLGEREDANFQSVASLFLRPFDRILRPDRPAE